MRSATKVSIFSSPIISGVHIYKPLIKFGWAFRAFIRNQIKGVMIVYQCNLFSYLFPVTISAISPDMVLNIVQYKIIVIMIMKTVHDLHKHSYSVTHCIPAGSSCHFLIVKLNRPSAILWSQFVLFPYR